MWKHVDYAENTLDYSGIYQTTVKCKANQSLQQCKLLNIKWNAHHFVNLIHLWYWLTGISLRFIQFSKYFSLFCMQNSFFSFVKPP